jgi:replication factor A1
LDRFNFKKQNIQQLISLKSLKGDKDNLPWINLIQLQNERLNTNYTLDYFMFRGTIFYIKHDTIAYPGCPTCAKKLQKKESSWECEQCKKILSVPDWRYVLFASISDFSGQSFFTIFDNVGVHIMGMTAAELLKIADRSMEIFQKEFSKTLFKTYNFKAKAKVVQYNVS